MGMKSILGLAAGALLASSALVGTAAHAQSIYVQVAPPAPRYEAVPMVRQGHSWVPGHWEWRRHQYVWVPGYMVAVRPGYYYAEPRWVQYGGRWGYHAGGWERGGPPPHARAHGRRDNDRDGVPNRRDRDRDGDGVPNRFDNRPNNPNRN